MTATELAALTEAAAQIREWAVEAEGTLCPRSRPEVTSRVYARTGAYLRAASLLDDLAARGQR